MFNKLTPDFLSPVKSFSQNPEKSARQKYHFFNSLLFFRLKIFQYSNAFYICIL